MRVIFILTVLVFPSLLMFTDSGSHGYQHRTRLAVFDSAGVLTLSQRDSISSLIVALEKQIGSQIAVVTIESLRGKKIEVYSIQIAEKLSLGRSSHNDGLLITVALQDMEIRTEVGTGLENIIRDEIASRFNREIMAPHFRNNKFCPGLYIGIDSISRRIVSHRDVGQKPRWK
jgi:uncharacterized protein